MKVRRRIARLTASGWNDHQIAAGLSFIAHQPFDECDLRTIGRPARIGELQLRFVNRLHRRCDGVDNAELRDPVVVVARSGRGDGHHVAIVRRPIEVIDVHVRRRDDAEFLRRDVDDGDALLVDMLLDHADRARHRHERTGGASRVFDQEKGDRLSVRRPARLGERALDRRQPSAVDVELSV